MGRSGLLLVAALGALLLSTRPAAAIDISGEFPTGTPVTGESLAQELDPDVACAQTTCLAAWVASEGQDFGVRFGRTDGTNTLLDVPSALLRAGGTRPRVAAVPAGYVVGWHRSDGQEHVLEAATVSEAGAVGSTVEVARAGYVYDFTTGAAPNGSTLFAWTEQSATGYDLHGAVVTAAGGVSDPFLIAGTTGYQFRPSVAASAASFMVAWQDGRNQSTWDVYGARVSFAGEVLDPAGIALSTSAADQTGPALASDGNGFFVAWTDARGLDTDVYGTGVSADAEVISPAGIAVWTASGADTLGDVGRLGGSYLATWDRAMNGGAFQAVTATTVVPGAWTVQAPFDVLGNTGAGAAVPRDAAWGSGAAFVWLDHTDGTRVRTRRVNADRSPAGGTNDYSIGANYQERPAISFDGTNYLSVWFDRRPGGTDLRAARIAQDGTLLDPGGIVLAANVAGGNEVVAAWNGTTHVVAWTAGGDVSTVRVSAAGVASGGLTLAGSALVEHRPLIAAGGSSGFLVAWTRIESGGTEDVIGAVLDASGNFAASASIATIAGGNERTPAVTFANGEFKAMYRSNDNIVVRGVTTAGAINGQTIVQSAGGAPFAAADDTGWVLGWRTDGGAVRLQRMLGTATSGTAQTIGGAQLDDPRLVFDGGSLVLTGDAWEGGARVQHISATLEVLAVDTIDGAEDPAIAAGPPATVGLVYSRWDDDAGGGATRAFVRTIRRYALEVTPDVVDATEGELLTFVVKLIPARTDATVTVDFTLQDLFAKLGQDYAHPDSYSLSFPPGVTTRTALVPTIDDSADEEDGEDVRFMLVNPSGADISSTAYAVTHSARGDIDDNDPSPSVSAADVSVGEAAGPATLVLKLSAPSQRPASISVTNWSGTATTGADFTYPPFSQEVSFHPVGSTEETLDVPIVDDAIDEPDEHFDVRLGGGYATTVGDEFARVTIQDDDPTPGLTVEPLEAAEGSTLATPVSVKVKLSNPSSQTVTAKLSTSDGTAVAPDDYTALDAATVSFSPGQLEKTVALDLMGDTADEQDETFGLTLTDPVNAVLAQGTAQVTIRDDDGPALSVGDAGAGEGDAELTFPITLSASTVQEVTGSCSTADGGALAGSDYTARSAAFAIPAGSTQVGFAVDLLGDQLDEADESLTLTCTVSSGASVLDGSAAGTIADDDAAPTLAVGAVEVAEGATADVAVQLSAPSGRTVTVQLDTADGTAAAPDDYADTGALVTFAPGDTSEQVAVAVAQDALDEPDETFTVALSGATNAGLGTPSAQVKILDDDVPGVDVADASAAEGAGTVDFQIGLSAPSPDDVTGSCATTDGTAKAGSDYVARTADFTVPAGAPGAAFTVELQGDALDEADETLTLTCSVTGNGAIGDGAATGTITDDDATPVLTVQPEQVTEGTGATATTAAVTVELSAASGRTVSVKLATADGAATAPADYAAVTTTLTFDPGETAEEVALAIAGDAADEPDEAFTVALSEAVNATIGGAGAAVTVVDDDGPAVTVSDATADEGDAGTAALGFQVALSAASPQAVSGTCTTADGTAAAGSDYTARSAAGFTVPAGAAGTTFTVDALGDTQEEANETFVLTCTVGPTATGADLDAVGTIVDDDEPPAALPTVGAADATVTEGASAAVQVSLSAASAQAVTVRARTFNGGAAAPADYAPVDQVLTFPAGTTAVTLEVAAAADALVEGSETLQVVLSDAAGATVARDAVVTILDATATGGTGGTGGVTEPAELEVAGGRLTVDRRGRTRIALTCPEPGDDPCTGALVLRTAKKVRSGGGRRVVTLARGTFTVPRGDTAKVALKLSRTSLRLVRRLRSLTVLVDAGGVRRTLRLRAP